MVKLWDINVEVKIDDLGLLDKDLEVTEWNHTNGFYWDIQVNLIWTFPWSIQSKCYGICSWVL